MSYRWLDLEQTTVRRESDGACIPAAPGNRDYAEALAAGIGPFQRWADLDRARADLIAAIEAIAERFRVQVAGASSPTKIAIYREKYAIALAAIDGDDAALARLAPEAQARGEAPLLLASLVKSRGEAWTDSGLAIDAAYQTHTRAIAALASLDAAEAYDTDAGWPG